MHLRAAAALGTALVSALLVGSCSSTSENSVTYQRYTYTCCAATDVTRVWHPGQTFTLHWFAEPADTTTFGPAHVTLIVVMTGPYQDVTSLKTGHAAALTLRAKPVAESDQTSAAPVSTIALPLDLPSGYYDVAASVESGSGNSIRSDTVIQVARSA